MCKIFNFFLHKTNKIYFGCFSVGSVAHRRIEEKLLENLIVLESRERGSPLMMIFLSKQKLEKNSNKFTPR